MPTPKPRPHRPQPVKKKVVNTKTAETLKTKTVHKKKVKTPKSNKESVYLFENTDYLKLFYRFLFGFLGTLNALIFLAFLYIGIEGGILDMRMKFITLFFLTALGLGGALFLGVLSWFKRLKEINEIKEDKYFSSKIFAIFLKAFGENIGAFLGIFGTYQSVLIFMILLVSDNPYQVNRMVSSLNLGFLSLSGVTIFVYPILGIGIMMFFKFLSERIFVSLSLEKSTYLLIKEKKETAEPVASTEKVL